MKILISYRAAPRIRGWETGALVAEAFRALGHEVSEYARMYETQEWVHCADISTPYDLAIYMECNDPDPQYLELKYVNAKKQVAYFFDISYYPDTVFNTLRYFKFDHIFCANPIFVDLLNTRVTDDIYSTYLPYAACSRFIRSVEYDLTYGYQRPIDVALVGSDRPERRDLINTLQLAGIKAQLISDVFKEKYIDALASAKIIINQNPKEGRGLLNMRFWEAQAAGALLLTEAEDLRANEEKSLRLPVYTGYTSTQDAIKMCKFYLDNLGDLKETASLNQAYIIYNHLYVDRAKKILVTLNL